MLRGCLVHLVRCWWLISPVYPCTTLHSINQNLAYGGCMWQAVLIPLIILSIRGHMVLLQGHEDSPNAMQRALQWDTDDAALWGKHNALLWEAVALSFLLLCSRVITNRPIELCMSRLYSSIPTKRSISLIHTWWICNKHKLSMHNI